MKIKILVIIVTLICLSSCKEKISSLTEDNVIKVDLERNKTTSLIADEIFESVRYIPLQTNKEGLISDIEKIKVIDDNIYLFDDKQSAVFIYDMNGNLLRKFRKRGRGHGEYLEPTDFEVDDKYLYVSARTPAGVLKYDKESFKFIDILASGIKSYRIICNDESLLIYTGNSSSNKEMKDIYTLDKKNGKITGRYKNLEKEKTGWTTSHSYLTKHNNDLYGFFNADYNIYQFWKKDYDPILSVDFGKDNMLPKRAANFSDREYDDYFKDLPDPYDRPVRSIDNLTFTDKNMYFSFIYLKQNNFAIYSLSNKNLRFGRIDGTEKTPLIGHLSCITPNDEVVMYMEASNLIRSLEYIKANNKTFTIPAELSKVAFDDNPVLIIYKIKDDLNI